MRGPSQLKVQLWTLLRRLMYDQAGRQLLIALEGVQRGLELIGGGSVVGGLIWHDGGVTRWWRWSKDGLCDYTGL